MKTNKAERRDQVLAIRLTNDEMQLINQISEQHLHPKSLTARIILVNGLNDYQRKAQGAQVGINLLRVLQSNAPLIKQLETSKSDTLHDK